MSEHQKETAFLRLCLSYDNSPVRQVLEDRLIEVQRNERCVWRALWLMAVLATFAVVGFGYAAVLSESFPLHSGQAVARVLFALGLASTLCLVVFVCIKMAYRTQLDQRREECRQLVRELLAARLGKPDERSWLADECRPGNLIRPAQTSRG